MQKVIAVVGPTASGKTALSVALAEHFGGEIVSVDSMQIYYQMNIGTAKPSVEERRGIPHHLMGHISVENSYNVAMFKEDALKVLGKLKKQDRLPVLCGGTGLYLDHLIENTEFFEIPIAEDVRQKYAVIAQINGVDALYAMLKEVDPVLAARLHPNDVKRVIRGLEVFETTGRRLSEFQADSFQESLFEVLYIGLNYQDRNLLYDRINRRVDLMMKEGLLSEILDLKENFTLSETARAAIGYKEILDSLEQGQPLEEAVELIKQKSRNYAKRQISWFKRNQNIHWLYCDTLSNEELLNKALELAEDFLK